MTGQRGHVDGATVSGSVGGLQRGGDEGRGRGICDGSRSGIGERRGSGIGERGRRVCVRGDQSWCDELSLSVGAVQGAGDQRQAIVGIGQGHVSGLGGNREGNNDYGNAELQANGMQWIG